jgi:hypothetical protein
MFEQMFHLLIEICGTLVLSAINRFLYIGTNFALSAWAQIDILEAIGQHVLSGKSPLLRMAELRFALFAFLGRKSRNSQESQRGR